MAGFPWTIRDLRCALRDQRTNPTDLARLALARANRNSERNTYLWQDVAWTMGEAVRAESMAAKDGGAFSDGRGALWGLPISVKDCFDLAGAPTSSGVKLYRDLNGAAGADSWLVEELRAAGAVITGKTHLHPLAYGITGENPDFGDCFRPEPLGDKAWPLGIWRQEWKPGSLAGGSSSGAAASVLEGSAVAAIGTDTGGSIRAPAALGGLAGYRATLGRGNWRGGAHLAESFDTMGWLFRDLEDAPLLAWPFAPADAAPVAGERIAELHRFAFVDENFLSDCEPEIVSGFRAVIRELESLGLESRSVRVDWWSESREIFAPIQAWEAARLHAGHFDRFQPDIRQRLEWGSRITPTEIAGLRERHDRFRARMDELLAKNELLLLPAIPVTRLVPGNNQSQVDTRMRLLRYTVPFSVAGVPVVSIPSTTGGVQLAARRNQDENLLALAARLGVQRKSTYVSQKI